MKKFKETFLKIWNVLKTKVSSISKKMRIIILSVASVLIIAIVAFVIIVNRTDYVTLFNNLSSTEASEILTYIQNDLGVADVKLVSGSIQVQSNQVEDIRVKLSIAGYPRTTFNYDIWNNGVTLFSTDSTIRETQRQQLQDNLIATLKSFEYVDEAIVNLVIPEKDTYVISADETPSSAGVVVFLRQDLNNDQINGMYNLIRTSVPGLKDENISIVDGEGKDLKVSLIDETQTTDEATLEKQKMELNYEYLAFCREVENILTEGLQKMFDGFFRTYNVNVTATLDYNNMVSEETEYSPSVDEEGNRGGMVSNETDTNAAGGVAAEGGLVGTTVDADIAPDYPTLTVGEDGEFYYESSHEINYLVNEKKTQVEKNGYEVKRITASVVVDSDTMTAEEEDRWRRIIANSIGAVSIDDVSIIAAPALLTNENLDDNSTLVSVNSSRDTLIGIIISLGALLLILLILAFTLSGSKKKRRISEQRAAIVQATANGTQINQSGFDSSEFESPEYAKSAEDGDGFEIQSLSDSNTETKETILKREIREFTKTNPEIVAQLIRNWMKSDDN